MVYEEKAGCGCKASDYLLRNGGKPDYKLFRYPNAEAPCSSGTSRTVGASVALAGPGVD